MVKGLANSHVTPIALTSVVSLSTTCQASENSQLLDAREMIVHSMLTYDLLIIFGFIVLAFLWIKRRNNRRLQQFRQRVEQEKEHLHQENERIKYQLQERQHLEKLQQKVTSALATKTGEKFFQQLCKTLAEELQVDFVYVARTTDDPAIIESVAICDHHKITDPLQHGIANSPCAEILRGEQILHSESLATFYPDSALIRDHHWVSYAGVPLFQSENTPPVGLVAVMDTSPFLNGDNILYLLNMFANRIASEMMRLRTENEMKLLATTFETHEAIAILDQKMHYLRVNTSFTEITGYQQADLIGKSATAQWKNEANEEQFEEMYQQLFSKGHWQGELWRKRSNGRMFLQWGAITAVYHHGKISHFVESFLDFTQQQKQLDKIERTAAEEQSISQLLRISLRPTNLVDYLNEVLDCLLVAIPWLNIQKKGAIFLVGKHEHALHLTASRGFNPDQTRMCRVVKFGQCMCGKAAQNQTITYCDETSHCQDLLINQQFDHGHYVVPVTQNGDIVGVLLLFLNPGHPRSYTEEQYLYRLADILSMGISRRNHQEHIEFLAYHDVLTDLPNRRLLMDRINQEIAAGQRLGTIGAILYLDLDRFKNTNDALGHYIGDQVLKETAHRLSQSVTSSDIVTRLSSDEFVILLSALTTDLHQAEEKSADIAQKIIDQIRLPYNLSGRDISLTCSIGIALLHGDDNDSSDLLRFADTAMHYAKAEGGNMISFFHPFMQSKAEQRLIIERELNIAIEEQQFQLQCQPQVDNLGRIRGTEFLVRWLHPEKGLISPADFIPIAEETGQIRAIDTWVLETACSLYCHWQAQDLLRELDSISVNISPQLFHQNDFVTLVESVLQRTKMPADKLMLELTEGILIKDMTGAIGKMDKLHRQGIRFSIDDFGTGYSSMSYLKRLSIDELKIDQSFIRDLTASRQDSAIVETIITLAEQLDLSLVSEGVETAEQRDLLFQKGCRIFQGYFFSRPLPAEELPNYRPTPTS